MHLLQRDLVDAGEAVRLGIPDLMMHGAHVKGIVPILMSKLSAYFVCKDMQENLSAGLRDPRTGGRTIHAT